MKIPQFGKEVLLAFVLVCMIISCKQECDPNVIGDCPEPENAGELESMARTEAFVQTMLGTIDPAQPEPTLGAQLINTETTQNGNTVCETKTYNQNSPFDQLILLKALDWFPGEVLLASSIADGSYRPFLYGTQAPICVGTELPVPISKMTFEAKGSAYDQAINDYLNQPLSRAVPINADFSIETIYSEEQLGLSLGAHLKVGKWVNISGSYSMGQNLKKTRVIVKLVQPFFKVKVDKVPLENFYSVPPTVTEMEQMGVDENGLVYISSIVYGRQLFLMIESTASEQDLKKALNAEFGFWKVNGKFEYSEEHKSTFEKSNMRVLIMGGDPTLGSELITSGLQGLENYVNRGAAFDPQTNSGVALSYQMRRVKDNSVFNVILASEYKIQECVDNTPNPYRHTIQVPQKGPYCPPLTRGDREIGDSGEITAEVELYTLNDREVWAKIHYKVYEVRADHSTAEDTWRIKLYTAPQAQRITKIISSKRSYKKYRDYDHGIDIFNPSGPVYQFLCIGDTPGDDLGNCSGSINNIDRSKLSIKWKPIEIELQPI